MGKVVELVTGGSVINGVTPFSSYGVYLNIWPMVISPSFVNLNLSILLC